MQRIELPRAQLSGGIAYHRQGSGPPVLLIHGVGLRAESWFPQIDTLSRDHTVFAIDLPGHGRSTLLDEATPAVSDYTAAVHQFIGDVVGEPAIIIGHSLGALITIDLAIRNHEVCRAIAPLNGVFQRTPEALAAVRIRATDLRERIGKPWEPALASVPVGRWFGSDPTGRDAELAARCRAWLEANNLAGYAAAYTAFASTPGPDPAGLAAIDIPALFLTGENDPNSTPDMSEAMASHVAGAAAVVVHGAAHMAGLTHDREVNEVLISFITDALQIPGQSRLR